MANLFAYPSPGSGSDAPLTEQRVTLDGPFASPNNSFYEVWEVNTSKGEGNIRSGQSGGAPVKRAPQGDAGFNPSGTPFCAVGVVSTGSSPTQTLVVILLHLVLEQLLRLSLGNLRQVTALQLADCIVEC